jgi:site-specific recombinase XerD
MKIKTRYNRRGTPGKASVELDVYFNATDRKFISTGIRIEKEHWDPEHERVRKHIHKENLNLKINNLRDKIIKWEKHVLLRGEEPTGRDLMAFLGRKTSFITFNDYLRTQLAVDKPRLATGTYKARTFVLDRFDKFGIIPMDGFTSDRLEKYHSYLLAIMKPQSTRNHHKVIDLYLKRALHERLITSNPYFFFKKPKTRKNPVFLTAQELNRLRQYEGVERIEKVRDIFLFQCLTGLSFIDMQHLKQEDVVEDFIVKKRVKTGESQMVPLLPEAKQILEKFKNDGKHCFPLISNQKMNSFLKELATIKNIPKPLTTHVGRHTFATLMLEKGLPLETLSHILGHSSTNTTKIYAKMLVSKIKGDLTRLNISSL